MMHGTETRKHHNSIVAIAMYKYISLLLIIVASFVHFEPSKPGFFSKSLCMSAMQRWQCIMLVPIIMIILATFLKVSAQCSHGEVRLVNSSAPHEGTVEVCINSNWATICNDNVNWGTDEAVVVCRQLGYTPADAEALRGYFGPGNRSVAMILYNIRCEPDRHMTILECRRGRVSESGRCVQRGSAAVRCSGDDHFIRNVSISLITDETPATDSILNLIQYYNVLVTWQIHHDLHDINHRLRTTAVLRSFEVRCFNDVHSIKISLSNTTFMTQIGGLLRSSYHYTCCISAVYDSYTAQGVCTRAENPHESQLLTTVTEVFSTEAETLHLNTTKESVTQGEITKMLMSEDLSARAKTVDLFTSTESVSACIGTLKSMNVVVLGTLGAVAAIFAILSASLCVALVIYRRSRKGTHNVTMTPMRSLQLADRCSMDVSTHDNMSYDTMTVPSNYYSKGNSDSSKAATSTCDTPDSTNQTEKLSNTEELQLYEIPNPDFGAISNGSYRDTEESHIYY